MTIVPLNVATVTHAIQDILVAHADVGGRNVPVERAGSPDDSAIAATGWVGIYPEQITYSPRTVGMGAGFMSYDLRVSLLVRFMHVYDASELEDALEELVQRIVGVLLSNPTLSGTVETTTLGQVRYSDFDKSKSGTFTQSAIVSFTFNGNTSFID